MRSNGEYINHIITNTTSTQNASDFDAEWLLVTSIYNTHNSDITVSFGDHGDTGTPNGKLGAYLMDFSMEPNQQITFPIPIRTTAVKVSNANGIMFFYAERD